MQTVLKWLALVVKGLSVVAGLAAYADALPPKWAGIAVLAFGFASILKDAVNRVGDLLDDGTINNSFKP